MSKLYDKYITLKSGDKETLYLFECGIFYIFLDDDAKLVANTLGLKLTRFNNDIYKCGFPVSSADKYFLLLRHKNFSFKVVSSTVNSSCNVNNMYSIEEISSLLNKISNVDTDTLSVKEAYEFIDNIKNIANSIKL
ncbi:MAG: hypothetical protein ACI4VQ_04560 [Clostridia bacterium]